LRQFIENPPGLLVVTRAFQKLIAEQVERGGIEAAESDRYGRVVAEVQAGPTAGDFGERETDRAVFSAGRGDLHFRR